MQDKIVIFRYHDHLDVVKQRVHWLRNLNPGIKVYGMYGGEKPCPKDTSKLFDDNYELKLEQLYKWRNLDLAVLEWYRATGRNISFSHAYIVEWDLVYLTKLSEVIPNPKASESLLTGYIPLTRVEHKWSWVDGRNPESLKEWDDLKTYVHTRYSFDGPYSACLGPGTVLSREFFVAYDALKLPLLCHDELRLPLIHDISGLKIHDTKLYPPQWHTTETDDWVKRFNCLKWEVTPNALYEASTNGHVAFHPVYKQLDESRIN